MPIARVWFVEGLPGCGKSTLAEEVWKTATTRGHGAKWYLEESADHPVHPKPWRALEDRALFAENCLQSWSRFTDRCLKHDAVHILEGSAFQSCIRFMMEDGNTQLEPYYRRFEEIITTLNPLMVYLRPHDAVAHSRYVAALRGESWTAKVSAYLERTSYSVELGLRGVEGMHRFWADYATRCDHLVAQSLIPIKTVAFVPGDWTRHSAEALAFYGMGASDSST